MGIVFIQGTIEEQREFDGSYATKIVAGDSRFQLVASGPAAIALAAVKTGQECFITGELVEEKWETQRDGPRSRVVIKVLKVNGRAD